MQHALRTASYALVAAALLSFGFPLWQPGSHPRAMFLGLALLDCCFLAVLWRSFLLRLPLRRRHRAPLTYEADRVSYVRVHVALTVLAAVILFVLLAALLWRTMG